MSWTCGRWRPVTSPFYSSEQTDLSRVVLGEVVAAVPDAVLIGGWASWVRTGGAMSHDIDLIVSRAELEQLRSMVDDLSESRHLGGVKWRATWRDIHLDLYVAHQSQLGSNLQLRVEKLVPYVEQVNGYRVLSIPAHTATKIAALLDRPDSMPGRKDRYEILRLLQSPQASRTPVVMRSASARTAEQLDTLTDAAFGFLGDGLNKKGRAALRRMATDWTAGQAGSASTIAVAPSGPTL